MRLVINDSDVPSTEKKTSYRAGDVAKPNDMRALGSEREKVLRASLLQEGDGAFVRRSDGTWRFATVRRRASGAAPRIDFAVSEDGSATKSLSLRHWASDVATLRGAGGAKLDRFVDFLVSCLEITEKEEGENASLKELVLLVPTKFQSLLKEDASGQPPLSEAIVTRRVPRRDRKSSSALFSSTTTKHENPDATIEDSD